MWVRNAGEVSFQKYVCHVSLPHLSHNSHLWFLSCTPSRNTIPCSVRAGQILGRREGARLGQTTKIQIPAPTPAGLATLRLLPSSSVKWGHSGPHDVLTANERWTLRVGFGNRTTHSQGSRGHLQAHSKRSNTQNKATLPEVTHPRAREPGK